MVQKTVVLIKMVYTFQERTEVIFILVQNTGVPVGQIRFLNNVTPPKSQSSICARPYWKSSRDWVVCHKVSEHQRVLTEATQVEIQGHFGMDPTKLVQKVAKLRIFQLDNLSIDLYLHLLENVIDPLITKSIEIQLDEDENPLLDEDNSNFQQDAAPRHYSVDVRGVSRCDPSKDIDVGFGRGYTYLKDSRSSLSENLKDVKLQYKLIKIKQLKDLRDARDSAKAVLHTVQRHKQILDQILRIFKRLLAFLVLRIILDSQKYHDKYLQDIDFDNLYITRYFRKIDARRKAEEKHVLLPLKKIEAKKLIDPWSPRPLEAERQQVVGQTLRLLLEMITAMTLVLLDWLFYEALELVRRHGRIDYLQTGRHDLMLEIKGTGMIASILRSVVSGFNVKKKIKIERTNLECLPMPNKLSKYYIIKIFGMYFAIWVLILVEAYTQRLNRVVCAYFYRKREKKRILFLYNETLKRRVGFFKFMKKKVEENIRRNRLEYSMGWCSILRHRYPTKCDWLRIFPMARRKCIVCQEVESCRNSKFVVCKNPGCLMLHCPECWDDMGHVCLACTTHDEDITDDEAMMSDFDSLR